MNEENCEGQEPRQLTGHKVNPCNDVIDIRVMDEKGPGGAHHRYHVDIPAGKHCGDVIQATPIIFQNGAINEVGTNGLTQEVLIEICIDRLRCFQAGPYACEENQRALDHLEAAQETLLSRTSRRMDEGTEGTMEPDKT